MTNGTMDQDNLPDELKALYAHRCPADGEWKAAYEQSVLSGEPDTFVLYRIIGNDLYPRHAKGQSRQNVRFILENEPELADCEKRWVVNRIFDAGERQAIIDLLEQHGQPYLEIPFEAEAFAQIGCDYSAYPEPGFLSSTAFYGAEPVQQERVFTAAYRKKNLYLMNNNGARNAALEDGRSRAKWVLPWDGNCFVTRSGWEAIRSAVRAAPHLPYFAVPMQRITDNAELLRDDFTPSPVEEPQLLFRRDARERFGENHPYGRRPKVELFWRLGIPGKWDRWKDDPWDQSRAEPSPDAGAWGVAGWVARLASGKAHLEASTTESFKNRGLERQKAIRAAINHVTREVSAQADPIGLTCYRFEAIEALGAEYREHGESGSQDELLRTLLKNAAEALKRQPESPVDKAEPGPSGDLQDYYHPAPYWWPNPDTKDGLPYVRRDGERVPGTRMYEPESHRYDRTRLQRLFDDSTTLALTAFVTGDQRYATHAVRWLERWFIDPATRMNPHLAYAQVRWGRNGNHGAPTGIIEMKDLYYALDAVRLLHHIGVLSSDQLETLRAWFRDYLDWLLISEQGTKEAQSRNNHGTFYDLQVAVIAAFLDDHDTLYATLARAEERIPLQISPTGIQHEEMTRTITAHYCCFTLQGWLNLLNLAARFDGSFVARAAEPDHPLRKAVEWLLAHEGFPWPYPQIDQFDSHRLESLKYLSNSLTLTSVELSTRQSPPDCYPPHNGVHPYWRLSSAAAIKPNRTSRTAPSPSTIPTNKIKERWLLCRPHGGLTDMLTQMWNCYDYAKRYDRKLVFDGSRSGLLDDLGNYFMWIGDRDDGSLSLDDATLSILNGLACKIFPIEGQLDRYVVRVGKKEAPCIGEKLVRYESIGETPLTFCFDRDYPDELLVHEQSSSVGGGGPKRAASMLRELCLTPEVAARCNKVLDNIPDEFSAIHVRNTDYETNYIPYLDSLAATIEGDVLICSDDARVREYAKMAFGPGRVFTVSEVPNTEGKRLHSNPKLDVADRFEHNVAAFVDLFAMACASRVYFTEVTKGKASGFSRLADILQKDPVCVSRLLGRDWYWDRSPLWK
ncbi:alginate lyase family protein [Thioalkalivibrio sp. AKL10]|uniref:alginate lyase family protein n=1 Tax=Thioalkalivibrio sp. AKL10 TaxID=1158158 RepID=UPI0003779AF1|nr:alginate lyase family protein [Thioalkalivibrio sp. AKL10]